jgi:hypothetical protein
MNKFIRLFIITLVFLSTYALQAHDSIPLKKWQKKKFETMITASTCIAPRLYGEGVVNNRNNKLAFGGNCLINYHFTQHLGLTWGFGALIYNRSFGQITNYKHDTAYFTTKNKLLIYGIAFLWNINPKDKVSCFINVGASCIALNSGLYFDGGSKDWLPPSKTTYSWLNAFYNLRVGIKIPFYKSAKGIVMLEYEDCFKPTTIANLSHRIYSKPRLLLINLGLCF